MSWTDERIETLKKMWDSGMTATQIAEELGGVSRNAVIGKAHRLGLPARPSPVKPNEPKAEPAPRPAPAASAAPPAAASAPAPQPAAPRPAPAPRPPADLPTMRSVGPGGFLRQNPGEQAAPIAPAPPRRLVPAKPSEAIFAPFTYTPGASGRPSALMPYSCSSAMIAPSMRSTN